VVELAVPSEMGRTDKSACIPNLDVESLTCRQFQEI